MNEVQKGFERHIKIQKYLQNGSLNVKTLRCVIRYDRPHYTYNNTLISA